MNNEPTDNDQPDVSDLRFYKQRRNYPKWGSNYHYWYVWAWQRKPKSSYFRERKPDRIAYFSHRVVQFPKIRLYNKDRRKNKNSIMAWTRIYLCKHHRKVCKKNPWRRLLASISAQQLSWMDQKHLNAWCDWRNERTSKKRRPKTCNPLKLLLAVRCEMKWS